MRLKTNLKLLALTTALILITALVLISAKARVVTDSPIVISATCPPFPPIARMANVSGEILVETKIDVNGMVISTQTTSGHPLLRKAAEEAAQRWQFAPSAGTDSNRTAQLIFVFRVMANCSNVRELTPIFYPPYKVEVRAQKPEGTCDDCSLAEQEKLRCKDQ